jgi:cytochrome P450
MKFAMLEMKAILSALLRKYQLLPAVPPHQLDLTVILVLKSLTGVSVRIQPRATRAATSRVDE